MVAVVEPQANVTVPVGTPSVPATVAVNVTDWPKLDGLSDDVTVVVLGSLLATVWVIEPVLVEKLASPL
jgi:hypothetical protein